MQREKRENGGKRKKEIRGREEGRRKSGKIEWDNEESRPTHAHIQIDR